MIRLEEKKLTKFVLDNLIRDSVGSSVNELKTMPAFYLNIMI